MPSFLASADERMSTGLPDRYLAGVLVVRARPTSSASTCRAVLARARAPRPFDRQMRVVERQRAGNRFVMPASAKIRPLLSSPHFARPSCAARVPTADGSSPQQTFGEAFAAAAQRGFQTADTRPPAPPSARPPYNSRRRRRAAAGRVAEYLMWCLERMLDRRPASMIFSVRSTPSSTRRSRGSRSRRWRPGRSRASRSRSPPSRTQTRSGFRPATMMSSRPSDRLHAPSAISSDRP